MNLLVCFLMLALSSAFRNTRNITPCDFRHGAFEGKQISVQGIMFFTMHGFSLTAQDSCKRDARHTAAVMFPNDQGSPSVRFKLETKAREQLRPYFRVNGGSSTACGIFIGQLFYKKHFHLDHIHGIAIGNGYGPSGALRAVFVLRSVDNIQPCTPTPTK